MKQIVIDKNSWHFRLIRLIASDHKVCEIRQGESDTCSYLSALFWSGVGAIVWVTVITLLLGFLFVLPVASAFHVVNLIMLPEDWTRAGVAVLIAEACFVIMAILFWAKSKAVGKKQVYDEPTAFGLFMMRFKEKICAPIVIQSDDGASAPSKSDIHVDV